MRNKFSKITLAAGFLLALAFTFSCHDGGGDDIGTSSSDTEISSSDGTLASSSSSGGSSSSVNISVSDTSGTFKDSRGSGQTYKWVKIGEQIWMAENLKFNAPGSKCYDNLASNCETYGRLYNWVMAANHCPDGWRLPSNAEWTTLANYIGNNSDTKLKATSGWNDDKNGTDDYGFTALPGGYAGSNGDFGEGGTRVYWWSTSLRWDHIDNEYISWEIGNYLGGGGGKQERTYLSVRCLKGTLTLPTVERDSFVDIRDNSTYKTVKIGAQKWMAENLKYKVSDSKCYNNLAENCAQYGRLYNGVMATNGNKSNQNPSGVQGVCPAGWHIPSNGEWTTLNNYIGSNSGRKLKSKSGWNDYYNGTDDYGFTALPGGFAKEDGSFDGGGTSIRWCSTSLRWDHIADEYTSWGIGTGNGLGSSRDADFCYVRCVEDIEMP